jgi:hypothetical protein
LHVHLLQLALDLGVQELLVLLVLVQCSRGAAAARVLAP